MVSTVRAHEKWPGAIPVDSRAACGNKLPLLESDTERAQLVKSARANLTSVR